MFQNFPEDNKNDDFLDDFRQKIANQSVNDLEEKRSEMKRSKNVFIGAVSGMALAFVVGWIVLSPRYENGDAPEIPVVRRPQSPVKVQPVEPGGMDIQNQDKSVYDIVEKKPEDERVVENLLPPPEEPKVPEVIETNVMVEPVVAPVVEAPVSTPVEAPVAPKVEAPVDNSVLLAQKKEEISKQLNDITKEETKVAAEAPKKTADKEINDIIKVQESIQNKPTKYSDKYLSNNMEEKRIEKVEANAPSEFESEFDEPAKTSAPKTVTVPVKTQPTAVNSNSNIPSGSWQLQLMASQSKSGVEKAFAPMAKKYPVLSDLPHEVEEADLGAKGMFYRLKAGAFQNKADADRVCKDLTALGGSCMVKKK